MQPPPRPDADRNEHVDDASQKDAAQKDAAQKDAGQKIDDYDLRQVTGFLFHRQMLLTAVLLVFIATRLWLLVAFQAIYPDTAYYGELAWRGSDRGQVAYRDFEVEYPPVAWWLIAAPRMIASETYYEAPWRHAETARRFLHAYYAWFHAELFLADLICWGLMLAIGRKVLPTAGWVLPAVYTLLPLAQPHLAYDRLDLVLLMFFLSFIYCWLTSESSVEPRSLESSAVANRWGPNLWAVASYFFLGLGISFKIMPVIFVPFLLLADLWAAGSAWKFAGRVLALVVGAVGPFLIYVPSAGWGVLLLFQYHGVRGTHLESIWSSIMLVAAEFGVPCNIEHSYGGYNLIGQLSGALKIVSGVAMLITAAAVGLWALLRGRRFDRRLALDAAQLVLINSTVLAHVFSPQYLNWLVPLALLLALNIFPRSWVLWCAFAVLVVAIVGISSWLFPYHYMEGLRKLQALPVALVVVRSVCLVGLALLLNIFFFAKYGLVPWRPVSPAHDGLAA